MKSNTQFTSNPRVKLLSAAIAAAMMLPATSVLAQQDSNTPEVEEVVVTGSFIRRSEGFQAASPILQVSAEDIAAEGTPNMGDVIHNLSFNQGSSVTQNSFTGASSTSTSINLRGLGSGATLNLVDGMRVIGTNVNTFLPQIAIGRMDIVTDGAAALYGSQAVAGVVNFVPRKSYDGVRFEAYRQGDSRGDYTDDQFSVLAGTEWNGIDLVVAGEYRSNGRLEMIDRPDNFNSGLTSSSTPNPGRYRVPVRDANGDLTGSFRTISDPNCGGTREDPTVPGNNPNGFTFAGQCWFDFGEFWDYRAAQDQGQAFAHATYDFSSGLTLSGQWGYFKRRTYNRGSPSNPGGRVGELPTVRGEIPGNPFPAVDANGNQLYAVDANGDGVPDRNANGMVIRAPSAATGIPFNEDVNFAAWRPWGKHGTLPTQLGPDGSTVGAGLIHGWRSALRADFTVPWIEGWEGSASYMYSEQTDNSRANNFSLSALTQGLNCDVANDRDACFTPFVSTDPSTLNTQAVADSTYVQNRVFDVESLQTLDVVLNGVISPGGFTLPGGEVGAAVGYQRREDRFDNTPSLHSLTGDVFIGTQLFPVSDGRTVDAYFVELSLPLFNTLEAQVAVRNEDYSTGQSSTDPKFGLVYIPTDWLTVRATTGTSFIAPTLNQLNAPESCGLTNVSDPFTTFAAFTANCSQGNPNLVPESADTTAFGVTLNLLDGMTLDIDWSETNFEDRIISSTTADILAADFFNFRQATGYSGSGLPPVDQVRAWVNNPLSDKRIQRDPNNVAQIDRIISSSTNASKMDVTALDLKFDYLFSIGDWGTMNFGLDATYVDSYTYQLSADRPVVEAKGNQNALTGAVPPMPEWKANASIGWNMGNHSANVIVRYIDEITFDAEKFSFQRFLPFSNYRNVEVLRASTITDASYNYSGLDALGGEFSFTVGARNLFDRLPQKVPMLGGMESILYDPTGRMLYGRVTFEM
ncbi:TonB-dependent receptor plug domain-containing protein [Pseudohongiella sp. O18]|uniref:TonB-dependent receptor plug domain-containing protein n=1 Tax=Pseudohongiella sp. O18 TaxID=2904248 RepID=UPI001F48F617|nr:TonB-dependent receptor [Pseudohongiella sp. O18]